MSSNPRITWTSWVKAIIQQTVAVYDRMVSVSVRMRGHGLWPRLNAGPCVSQSRCSCRYVAYGLYLYLWHLMSILGSIITLVSSSFFISIYTVSAFNVQWAVLQVNQAYVYDFVHSHSSFHLFLSLTFHSQSLFYIQLRLCSFSPSPNASSYIICKIRCHICSTIFFVSLVNTSVPRY